jgi:hypothetical protein
MRKDSMGSSNILSFDQFVELLKKDVKRLVGEEYCVTVNCVMKVNQELQGLNIRHKDAAVSPSVYLEDYYQEYQQGKVITKIADEIIEISKNRKMNVDAITEDIRNYEWVKSKLRVKLINFEKNFKMLQTIPHERILDLAVVPYVLLSKGEEIMSVTISNKIMDFWGISTEKILSQAKDNTLTLEPVVVEKMTDFIYNMILKDLNNTDESDRDDQEAMITSLLKSDNEQNVMYILTNQNNRYGAFAAFQPDRLSGLADRLGVEKLLILPSSIHELLAIPGCSLMVEKLKEMVYSINRSEVSEEEFLSDGVYEYDRIINQLSIKFN